MHLDITFRLQVLQRCSLDSVLFRESFNHPYISLFHLLVMFLVIFTLNFIIMTLHLSNLFLLSLLLLLLLINIIEENIIEVYQLSVEFI